VKHITKDVNLYNAITNVLVVIRKHAYVIIYFDQNICSIDNGKLHLY